MDEILQTFYELIFILMINSLFYLHRLMTIMTKISLYIYIFK